MKLIVKTRTTLNLKYPNGYMTIDRDGTYVNHETTPLRDTYQGAWYSSECQPLGVIELDERPSDKHFSKNIWKVKDFVRKYGIK